MHEGETKPVVYVYSSKLRRYSIYTIMPCSTLLAWTKQTNVEIASKRLVVEDSFHEKH